MRICGVIMRHRLFRRHDTKVSNLSYNVTAKGSSFSALDARSVIQLWHQDEVLIFDQIPHIGYTLFLWLDERFYHYPSS